jgi:NitT/TauT family transport system permease protein
MTLTGPSVATTPTSTSSGGRGRRHAAIFRIRGELAPWVRITLGAAGLASLFLLWVVAADVTSGSAIVPTPAATWSAAMDMWDEGVLIPDLAASTRRVAIGYSISVLIGVVLGVLIGSFKAAEAFIEPQVGFLRYIPATALLPVFLFWLGIDETPKVVLIVVGTVFYNILMVADVARAVPRELIAVSYTLGAGRLKVLGRVILPHSVPGMIDVARINLAAAWLMLVVAEFLAAPDGLALRVIKAQRFRSVDRMFAILILFGLIGMASDQLLRWARDRVSPWARS